MLLKCYFHVLGGDVGQEAALHLSLSMVARDGGAGEQNAHLSVIVRFVGLSWHRGDAVHPRCQTVQLGCHSAGT